MNQVNTVAARAIGGLLGPGCAASSSGTDPLASGGHSAESGSTISGGFGGSIGSAGSVSAGGMVAATGGTASAGAPAGGAGTPSGGGEPGGAAEVGGGGSTGAAGAGMTAGAGGTLESGGATAYSPCASKTTPCKIMPLGESITQGYRSSDGGGYRVELFQASIDAKTNVTFVGSQTSGPTKVGGVAFPQAHEGHGGYTIDGTLGIQPQIVNWIKLAKPDIITLMVGTNDVNNYYAYQTESAADLTAAPTRLGKLMDTIVAQDAHVLLFVAQITPTTIDAENVLVKTYNDAIPTLVKARADAGKHVALADMYMPIAQTPSYKTTLLRGTSDSLHPAEAGYKLMGDVWYAALKSALP